MTTNPPAPATTTAADPPASGELDKRVGKIEAEQREQRGLLEQILSKVGHGGQPSGPAGAPAPAAGGAAGGGLDLAAIQQQVRDEIAQADQRRAAEQTETKWRDDVNKTLEQIKAERQPREPETGVRALVQRMIIGRQS